MKQKSNDAKPKSLPKIDTACGINILDTPQMQY